MGLFGLVLGEGLRILAVGLAVGLGGAFIVGQTLQSQLYGVGAMDPAVVGGVAVLLGSVALIATLVPAQRARRIDPAIALTE